MRAASLAPPIVGAAPPATSTPCPRLASAVSPSAASPIRLPSTRTPVTGPTIATAPTGSAEFASASWLPDTRFPSPGAVPPTTTSEARTVTPLSPLAAAAVPATFVPRRLPATVVPVPADVTSTPCAANRLIASPRTTLPGADTVRPLAAVPALVPFSSSTGAAVHPGCVRASITSGAVIGGSAEVGETVATPPEPRFSDARNPPAANPSDPPAPVVPFGIMNTRCSMPAARPACARPVSPSASAFTIACRNEPWPASLVFTTVEKLNPKSTPARLPEASETDATLCAVPPETPVPALNT